MAKSNNNNLQRAKDSKKDEFYTRLEDIEKELKHYREHFRGKVVYCNCDDPRKSNFFHFFSYNFEKLGLKKLISTSYESDESNYTTKEKSSPIFLEYEGDLNNNNIPDISEIAIQKLQGDGDFRSMESIEFLKQSDIVVTNPPFSLFRDFIALLMEHDKKFIVIGSMNSITYKEIFNWIKLDKIWLGNNSVKRFQIPEYYEHNSVVYEDEVRYAVFGNVCWFTNLEFKKRFEDIILYKSYLNNESEYPCYDNYNAIEVSKTTDIPNDYYGYMGVPISFLFKYNPNQFEIVGSDYDVKSGQLNHLIKENWNGKLDRAYLNGKRMYSRLIIKLKTKI